LVPEKTCWFWVRLMSLKMYWRRSQRKVFRRPS